MVDDLRGFIYQRTYFKKFGNSLQVFEFFRVYIIDHVLCYALYSGKGLRQFMGDTGGKLGKAGVTGHLRKLVVFIKNNFTVRVIALF